MYSRLLIILLATLFHFHQLVQDVRFHPDEAYFMTFSRQAAVNGDWMLSGALDKPPLSIYSSALSMVLIGNTTDTNGVLHLDPHAGEFAGRFPNVLMAILLVPLMMRLAHQLYHDEHTTRLAGLLSATSPYILGFGATAFTDMSLLFWLVTALTLTVEGKAGWTGLALGLAFWSKQQAIFYVPLLVLMMWLSGTSRERWRRFSAVTGGMLFLLLLWDVSRPEASIFLLGTINNAPDSLLVDPSNYLSRLLEWLSTGQWLIGIGWVTGFMLVTAVIGWLRGPYTLRRYDILFGLFILTYVGLHTMLAFNQYDRYLLLILPPLIVLCARGLSGLSQTYRGGIWRYGVVMVLVLSAIYVLRGGIPVGGDKGDYRGIDELADYLNRKPVATVIYDRWLGWELGYYMGQWTNKRRVYFPTPQALVDGALALDEIGDRYLVAPVDQPVDRWLNALESAGFTVQVDYQSPRFMVYRLRVPAWDA